MKLVCRGRKMKLTSDVIVNQYLATGYVEQAVNLLLTIDWDRNGEVALASLQTIVTYLIRLPLNPFRESKDDLSLFNLLNYH